MADITEAIGIEQFKPTTQDVVFGLIIGILYIGLISFSSDFAFAQPSLPQASTGTQYVTSGFLAPLAEEIGFRGILLWLFMNVVGLTLIWAVLIQAGVFSIYHYLAYLGGAEFSQVSGIFLGATIFGIIAGFIAYHRKNLVAAIIPHAMINIFILVKGLSIVGVSII